MSLLSFHQSLSSVLNLLQIFLTKMSAGLMKSCIRIVIVHLGKHPGVLGITWQENLPLTTTTTTTMST